MPFLQYECLCRLSKNSILGNKTDWKLWIIYFLSNKLGLRGTVISRLPKCKQIACYHQIRIYFELCQNSHLFHTWRELINVFLHNTCVRSPILSDFLPFHLATPVVGSLEKFLRRFGEFLDSKCLRAWKALCNIDLGKHL